MPVGGNFTNCNCGPGQACENPTQPVATVGLCLADGTPIAVTVVRDCAGNTTSEGWINLATGTYTTGPAPEGVTACGDSRSITTNGTFCDVDPDTGDVLGLVLVEYQYAPDGSIDSVRLVDAVTGDTYTPQGTITTCPAGIEAPERDLVQLCNVSDDESGTITSTPFVRDYNRDENGAVTGYSDYTLDGDPYTPTGTVTVCQPEPEEPCASTVTVLRLCDLDPDVEPNGEGKRCAVPFLRHLVYDCTGALVETRDTEPDGETPYTPVQVVDCGSGGAPAMVEVPWEVIDIQPDPDSAEGRGFIFTLSPANDPSTVGTVKVTTTSTANTQCPGTPPEYVFRNPCTYTFTPDQALQDAATYVRCDLLDFDTFEPITNLNPPPDRLGGTAYWDGTTVRPVESNGTGEMYYDGPPETWSYRVGNTGGGNSCTTLSFAAVSLRAEGCCADCGGGGGDGGGERTVQEVCVIANSAPDVVMRWTRVIEGGGTTIYYLDQNGDRYDNTLPAGHQIVACPGDEPEPCRDTSTLLLCDLPVDGATGTPTAADTDPVPYPNSSTPFQCVNPRPGGGAALWAGGALTFAADTTAVGTCNPTNNLQVLRGVAATLQADRPSCDTGEATVIVSARFRNNGPSATAPNYRGGLRLHRADTGERLAGVNLAAGDLTVPSPSGYTETLTVTATVPAGLLAAGDIVVAADVETFEGPFNLGAAWTLDEFTASYEYAQAGCETQFLRTVVTDCETGQVASTTDTTLDGEPYTPSGEVGQCQATGGGVCCPPEPRVDVETAVLCVRDTVAGDVVARVIAERVFDDQTGALVEQRLTTADGAPYTLPDGAELVDCGEITEPCRDSATVLVCDLPTDTGGALSATDTTPADNGSTWVPLPGGAPALWAGSVFVLPADPDASAGDGSQLYRTVAAAIQRDRPGCDDGTATVTASVHLRLDGPTPGYGTTGHVRLDNNGTLVAVASLPASPPVGYEATFTVTGVVPAADLAAGNVVFQIGLETYQNGPKSWTLSDFAVDAVYDQQDCAQQFLRRIVTDCETGETVSVTDTTLDGEPYEVTGVVGQCEPVAECCPLPPPETRVDVEIELACLVDEASGEVQSRILIERVYDDQTGELVEQRLTDLNGQAYTLPDGAELTTCAEPVTVLEECRCDDTGDEIVSYVELIAVDADGTLSTLGTYTEDLSGPYTPVSPVECPVEGAPPATGVQARRVQLSPGQSWDLTSQPLAQSVTVTAHGGTGSITTADGTSTLHAGESITWSVQRDVDAALTGPLTITAGPGTVTVTYTIAATI